MEKFTFSVWFLFPLFLVSVEFFQKVTLWRQNVENTLFYILDKIENDCDMKTVNKRLMGVMSKCKNNLSIQKLIKLLDNPITYKLT